MYRKEIFSKYGYYNPDLRTIENYELILRLLKNGVKGLHIELPLFIYVQHENSMSNDRELMMKTGKQLGKSYGIKYTFGKYHPRNAEF